MNTPSGADTGLLAPVRVGAPAEQATSDEAWLRAMLDAEVGLVRAQASLGVVPQRAADAIAKTASTDVLDPRTLAQVARGAANPVVGLVSALTAAVAATDPAAADYVHRGSTSQDIMDTAAMLVAHRTSTLILADLRSVAAALARLAEQHQNTAMPGRTLAMHAVPTTFGLKAAGWLQGVLDAAQWLERLRTYGMPAQLGGAAGTLAGYAQYARIHADSLHPSPPATSTTAPTNATSSSPDAAPRSSIFDPAPRADTTSTSTSIPTSAFDAAEYISHLIAAFSTQVGLAEPVLPWHAVRTPFAELGAALAAVTGALGKIALDVQTLSRTEIAEAAEPAQAGRGVSSAMPHKRNPALATLIRSAALQVPPLALILAQSMLAEDERSAGAWHAEWQPLRECLRLTGGAAYTAVELVEGLTIDAARMRSNLDLTGSLVISERIAAVLAPVLGKAPAQRLLTQLSAQARETGKPLRDLLRDAPELAGQFTDEQLADLTDPVQYTGVPELLIARVLARHATWAKTQPAAPSPSPSP
jgi:3-carboxy-cis,cis-muconate cycloisomerase